VHGSGAGALTPEAETNRLEKPMDPFVTLVVLTVLVMSGVWGSIIIVGLLKRNALKLKLKAHPDDPRIDELQEDHHQLEARLERLEEELSFFRELQRPESPTQLPRSDSGGSEAKS
jgi:hypothetical protein